MQNRIPGRPGYESLRRGRWSHTGGAYLVTTITYRRTRHFQDWLIASRMAALVNSPAIWHPHAELLCWVLMPDHFHGLIQLQENASLSNAMRAMKGRTARMIRPFTNAGVPIWAEGFHDRALRDEESMTDVARYVVANPVRAGLVRSVRCYPYWNAKWL